METISFKVPSDIAQELDNLAGQQHGGSRHMVARQLVLQALTDDRSRVLDENADVNRQLEKLRHSLATAVVALLVNDQKVEQADAESWVRKAILGE